MGAKAIIQRYIDRNRSRLPLDSSKLREHIASVAEGSGLKITEAELDELSETGEPTPNPSEEGNKEEGEKRAKSAQNSRRKSKRGDSTKTEI